MPALIACMTELLPQTLERVRALAPHAEVVHLRRADEDFAPKLAGAQVLLGSISPAELERAPKLRWVQLTHVGVRGWERLPEGFALTTAAGVFGVPIAEHVLAMMLAFARGIPLAVRLAPEARWKQPHLSAELCGATCAVIGLGDIGRTIAQRCKALGMTVLAIRRTAGPKPEYVDELHPLSGLDEILPRADHVVLALPGTPHTRHLIDARRLALLKPSALLYNIGRGTVVDEPALIAALQAGQLAGAGLDVFEQEPLPAESPLWRMEQVIVTPHRSGRSPHLSRRLGELFTDNLQRYIAGEPLRNRYDPQWGY